MFREDWRTILAQAWSVRVAAFWGLVSGVVLFWPAMQGVVSLPIFAGVSVVACVAVAVARITKQPGLS